MTGSALPWFAKMLDTELEQVGKTNIPGRAPQGVEHFLRGRHCKNGTTIGTILVRIVLLLEPSGDCILRVSHGAMTISAAKSFGAVLEPTENGLGWVGARIPFDVATAWPLRRRNHLLGIFDLRTAGARERRAATAVEVALRVAGRPGTRE